MKIYNRQLEKIEDEGLQQRVSEIMRKVQNFLVQNYGLESQTLEKRAQELSIVTFSKKDDQTYIKTFDGKPKELPISTFHVAWHGQKSQRYDGDMCYFEDAIFIDATYTDDEFEHTFAHEFFHHLSSDSEMKFDENGHALYKTGVSIGSYDRNDNLVSRESIALTEGITEALTIQYMEGRGLESYIVFNKIATILMNRKHPKILEAYFSNNKNKVEEFYKDFEARQEIVSSEELKNLYYDAKGPNAYFPIDKPINANLIRGCLEYSLSYCENMEQLIAERRRLLPIFKSMANDPNIEYSDENFDIREMVNSVFNARRTMLTAKKNTQALGKETIIEQKDTAFIDETEQAIENEQKAIENSKDNTQSL